MQVLMSKSTARAGCKYSLSKSYRQERGASSMSAVSSSRTVRNGAHLQCPSRTGCERGASNQCQSRTGCERDHQFNVKVVPARTGRIINVKVVPSGTGRIIQCQSRTVMNGAQSTMSKSYRYERDASSNVKVVPSRTGRSLQCQSRTVRNGAHLQCQSRTGRKSSMSKVGAHLQSPSRTAISGVQVSTSKTYRYVRGAVLQSALPFYRTLQ